MLRIFVAALCVLLAGCSATVTHEVEKSDSTGIRYYRNAPYLLVYSDGRGGLSWQVIYMPDQSEIMTATPEVVGGATQMTLSFQNGVLSGSSVTGDTTAVPKAVISAILSALPLIAKSYAETQRLPYGFPAPYLFKIVVRHNTASFIGGEGTTSDGKAIDIQVPVNSGASS
jgi:hypothetical protein